MDKMKKLVIFNVILMIFFIPKICVASEELTLIMGDGEVSAEAMYLYLIEHNKKDGLNPIDEEYAKEFVINTIKEANAEGVRYDIAFALMMHETGFLNFGGDVLPVQNNFGGLGATRGGTKGAEFENMQMGIRGVVQHLKCYASDENLVNEVVDTRFANYLREKAVYAEWLGKADNPYGYGWAVPGKGYGYKIVSMVEEMKGLDTSSVEKINLDSVDSENTDNDNKDNEDKRISLTGILDNLKGDSLNIITAAALLFIFANMMRKYVSFTK